jgi:hypothetical protein
MAMRRKSGKLITLELAFMALAFSGGLEPRGSSGKCYVSTMWESNAWLANGICEYVRLCGLAANQLE